MIEIWIQSIQAARRDMEVRDEPLFHVLSKPLKQSIKKVRRRRYGSTHKAMLGEAQRVPAIHLTHKANPQRLETTGLRKSKATHPGLKIAVELDRSYAKHCVCYRTDRLQFHG
jgi:hypothetical protein